MHTVQDYYKLQKLCEIATYSSRLNPYGIIKLQKETSQKTMKGKNFKPTAKLEEVPSTPFQRLDPTWWPEVSTK